MKLVLAKAWRRRQRVRRGWHSEVWARACVPPFGGYDRCLLSAPCLVCNDDSISFERIKEHLIDIAPAPILARLERLDDGMVRRAIVLGRVFVLRAVTTTDMPARLTQTQVYPRIARAQTVFATFRTRRDRPDLFEMF